MKHTHGIRQMTLAATALLALGSLAGAQTLASLPDGPETRSNRIRLLGSGFGLSGNVLVDGIPAITTTWVDDEIHAYIPETASLGPVNVQVVTAGGSSNSLQQDVLLRQNDGRVAWRFRMTSVNPPRNGAAVAPDGTIYVDDSWGRLFALAPDGALLWMYDGNEGVPGVGHEGPVEVADDGTIIYGTNPGGTAIRIHAVNPDGTRRWMFEEFSLAFRTIAGPSIGPDGNIYAAFDSAQNGTLGAFSLNPLGTLRWSNPGTPFINHEGALPDRIEFSHDAFFMAFREDNVAQANYLFGFELDGTQRFAVPNVWASGRPHVRSDGSMVVRWGNDNVLRSLDDQGVEQWTRHTVVNLTEPVLDSSGVTYMQTPINSLYALNPDGSERWVVQSTALGWMNWMGVSPDDELLMDGGRAGFGQPGWIRAYRTVDGGLEWSISLPEEDTGHGLADVVVQGEPAFTPDSTRVYVPANTLVLDTSNQYCYLYAVDRGAPGAIVEDCFGEFGCPCFNSQSTAGCSNSTGAGAFLTSTGGSLSVAADDLLLTTSGMPAHKLGLLFMGQGTTNVPLGAGIRCVDGGIVRLQVKSSGAVGVFTHGPGLAASAASISGSNPITAGTTWRFQTWYRDPSGACGAHQNLSNAVQVTFAP